MWCWNIRWCQTIIHFTLFLYHHITWMLHFEATCWVIHRNSILNRFLLKTSFYCFLSLTFITFLIHWPLSPAASSVLMTILFCLFWAYIWNIQWRWSLYVCILHFFSEGCYHVTAAPYIRSVVMSLHSVTLLMTIWNAQWTLSFLYSLKFFL